MFIDEIVRMNSQKWPDRTAVIAGDVTLTFGELRDRCFQIANAMREIARPGDRVAILAENIPEYVACYYGVPAAGMTLTFLNYRLHPREWAWILNNSGATTLIAQAKFLESLEPFLDSDAPGVRNILVIEDESGFVTERPLFKDLVDAAPASEPPRDYGDDATAWLIYTSGTTGFPKGAVLTHRNLEASVLQTVIEFEPKPDDKKLFAFPLCHVSGYTVLTTQLRGGCVVLAPTFDPVDWMELVDDLRITETTMAPTMLNTILQHPKLGEYKLDSLRGIGYGSAAIPVEVLRRAIDRFGPIVYSGFGMTELSGTVLVLSRSAHERAASGEEHLLASCGRAMCLVDVKLIDENMEDCPTGVVGEIVVRGDQVLKEYINDKEGTAKSFHDGWFRSGDLAYRDDEGYFYIVDRLKDMILTGGENVYSREVEEAIYAHPAVSEAAVIGLPDPHWGESVTAVVVLRDGASATESDIIETTHDRLASYKKPKRVVFINEMPKTVNGKILKRELREQIATGATTPD